MGNAFHQAAVSGDYPSPMIYHGAIRRVEFRCELLLRQRHAHRHGKPLAQRPRCRFNPRALAEFRVPRSLCVKLPKVFEVLQTDVIAREVE